MRQIAHYVDQFVCYLGYLWPLWDDKRQTLADKIMGTVCAVESAAASTRAAAAIRRFIGRR